VLARVGVERAQDPEALLQIVQGLGVETVESPGTPLQALERALALRRPDEWVVLTGSIRFAGALRGHLCKRAEEGDS
jgi:folylpolyglutamate synthase/dihydropteroate synthase